MASPRKRNGVGLVGGTSVATMSVGGAVGVEPELDPDDAAAAAVIRWFERLVEQMTRAPPPLAEPLHWLILTPLDEGLVPVAVHFSCTRVPPFAEPLHWVMVAFVVLAGKGSHSFAMPSPEPTH